MAQIFADGMLYMFKTDDEKKDWLDFVQMSLQSDLADIQGTYFASGGHFWVATIDENGHEVVVGIVGLEGKGNGAGELRRMAVKAEYRRHGVGRRLVAHLEQWATAHSLTKVWLSTGVTVEQARKFYASLGYTEFKIQVVSQDPYFEVVFLEKTLA